MGFWLIAVGMIVAVAAPLLLAVWRGGRDQEPAAAYDLRLYRDQLGEVDRDLARGLIDAETAELSRAKIGRKVIAADRELAKGDAANLPPRRAQMLISGLVALALVATAAIYVSIGAPGVADLPLSDRIDAAADARANRPSQLEAEATAPPPPPVDADEEIVALVERLRTAMAENPDDERGLSLLAQYEARLGNFVAAREAQERLLDAMGDAAGIEDRAALLDIMVIATGGYVSPEAEQEIATILRDAPDFGPARYYLGLMFLQTGRPDTAYEIWAPLLREGPPNAPWIPPIAAQINGVAQMAGVPDRMVPNVRGPDADAVAAAAEMSAADRAEMIEGMVSGLADRLATEGGSAEEWAQLIRALGVLDRGEEAKAIWTEAAQVFAASPTDLALLRSAARSAGVEE